MATSIPLAVPSSASSKRSRSRSRDSARSSAASSRKNLFFHSPVRAPSETRSLPEQPPSPPRPETPAGASIPAFLHQSKSDISSKFVDLEWEQRRRHVLAAQITEPISQWARVTGEEVSRRNRYQNVDPYLNNRVCLNVPEGCNDYINASPILLTTTKTNAEKRFIATQGPKELSHHHLWRMIWDESDSTGVIVMLTQTFESGKEKCFQYFPHSLETPTLVINEHDEFADGFIHTVTLVAITEDPATRSTIRELEIKSATGETKKIWHFLFAVWPDFLVPEGDDRSALISLIKLTREKCEGSISPRIVHCSAGVGRSGTFIALDYLLSELEEGSFDEIPGDQDPIVDIVDKLRSQRMMMVQGEGQFQLLYDVLREQWIERWAKLHGEETAEGDAVE